MKTHSKKKARRSITIRQSTVRKVTEINRVNSRHTVKFETFTDFKFLPSRDVSV